MIAQTSLDVTQALAPRQLREGKTQILVEARKPLDLAFTVIALDTTSKRRQRQMLQDLGKDVMAFGHWLFLATVASQGLPDFSPRRNRDRLKIEVLPSHSISYQL